MKKTIFTLTLLSTIAIAGQSLAQEKGQFWIGGSVNTSNSESTSADTNTETEDITSNKESKRNQYTIQPEFGYAFSDRWAAGMQLHIGWSNEPNSQYADSYSVSSSDSKTNSWGLSPFVRYTALKRKAFGVFIDGGLSYYRAKNNTTAIYDEERYSNGSSNNDRYGIFVNPGFSLRLSPCILLTASMSFFSLNYTKTSNNIEYISSLHSVHSDNNGFTSVLNSPFNLDNFSVGLNFSF